MFSKVSVPEMIRFNYGKRFAVGVVAGSSVLGMLIPPSVMLIIYAFVAEQSIGAMFLAGIVPGLLLATAFGAAIFALSYLAPGFVGGPAVLGETEAAPYLSLWQMVLKMLPVVILIIVVLGGIYGGVVTAIEAGAAGALIALVLGLLMRRFSLASLWRVLVESLG